MAGQGAVTLKLRPGDQQKLNNALKKVVQRTDANIPVVMKQAGHVGVNYCKINCPVITGRLRVSIGNPIKEGIFLVTRNSVIFGTSVDYALDVEEGTKAHIIRPGKKGFLAWPSGPVAQKISFGGGGITRGALQYATTKTKSGLTTVAKNQKYIFTKKPIRHPGFRGRHYMLRGVQQGVPKIIEVLSGVVRA